MIRGVSGVLVTRGNVDVSVIINELPFDDVVVWNNMQREDLGVYGRYAAIEEARHPIIYVQDDDCALPPVSITELHDRYKPGFLTANMPQRFRKFYPDLALVGFGAIFDRDLPGQAFARFAQAWPDYDPGLMRRRADVIFAALTPHRFVDVTYANLKYATAGNRSYRQPGHTEERQRVLRDARSVR
jgi:hypothetical protein